MVELAKSQRLILAFGLFLVGCQPINCGEKELKEGLQDFVPEGQVTEGDYPLGKKVLCLCGEPAWWPLVYPLDVRPNKDELAKYNTSLQVSRVIIHWEPAIRDDTGGPIILLFHSGPAVGEGKDRRCDAAKLSMVIQWREMPAEAEPLDGPGYDLRKDPQYDDRWLLEQIMADLNSSGLAHLCISYGYKDKPPPAGRQPYGNVYWEPWIHIRAERKSNLAEK